jgi:hypothetical protein
MRIIEHSAFTQLFCATNGEIFIKCFENLNNFSTLLGRINRVSERFIKDLWELYPDDNDEPGLDRLKGDLFEIFIMCFIKILGADPKIGISEYKETPPGQDYGVDGFGIGMDTRNLTVQIKFRSDPTTLLTERDIKQFLSQSILRFNVNIESKNFVLISSCKLHPITATEIGMGRITDIGFNEISLLIDQNNTFWYELKKIFADTVNVKFGGKVKNFKIN